jgi:hypothetical protein
MRGVRGGGATVGCKEVLGLVIGCVDRGRALVRCDEEEPRGRGDNAGVDIVLGASTRQNEAWAFSVDWGIMVGDRSMNKGTSVAWVC